MSDEQIGGIGGAGGGVAPESAPASTPAPASAPAAAEGPVSSTAEAVARALASWDGDDGDLDAPAAGAAADQARARDERGRFAPKAPGGETQQPAQQAEAQAAEAPQPTPIAPPARLNSPAARAAWGQAPAEVREGVEQAFRELESGIGQYRERLAAIEPLERHYRERYGVDLPTALQSYQQAERMLAGSPIDGVTYLAQTYGWNLEDLALQLFDRASGAQAQPSEADRAAQGAEAQRVARLEQQFAALQSEREAERRSAVLGSVEAFRASHPRFDELAPMITRLLQTGMASDLRQAYDHAERLAPAPQAAQAGQRTQTSQPARTRPATSITGPAPTGSQPVRAMSVSDGVARAMAMSNFE